MGVDRTQYRVWYQLLTSKQSHTANYIWPGDMKLGSFVKHLDEKEGVSAHSCEFLIIHEHRNGTAKEVYSFEGQGKPRVKLSPQREEADKAIQMVDNIIEKERKQSYSVAWNTYTVREAPAHGI